MIKLVEFIQVFDNYFKHEKYIDDLSNTFNIDFFDTPIYETSEFLFTAWLKTIIKPEYLDIISAYTYPEDWRINGYERSEEYPLYIYDSDGTLCEEISTVEQLYNYIKRNNGFYTSC